ncbi:urokinase plasminogen activator surface receptor [Pangasianodon hypophthalmus]|uniref:urokinase plasminogen activator surface receptor n=1 Tax=Pangasianodon hypophthalmus TaxID=310915 RepID=UPI000EFF6E0C|nr:urokinase plasminogen activator surface receptor [Pangasianodon hypophthalmus]
MMSQVTLLLICMLFSKALSLSCFQCLPPGTCVQTTCLDQCLTTTASVYTNGTNVGDYSIKTCSLAGLCTSGSLNVGTLKLTSNAKCCSTDLCNSETLQALPAQASNGRMCYSCDGTSCSGTVSCEGVEDRCFTASVQQGNSSVSFKGCVSKNICVAAASTSILGFSLSNVQCCEGNLCNGAESFTLSFLLMIVPLLSSILFY